MGQHKSNPTAQLAKEGKIPPKKPRMSAAERDRRMQEGIATALVKNGLAVPLMGLRGYQGPI